MGKFALVRLKLGQRIEQLERAGVQAGAFIQHPLLKLRRILHIKPFQKLPPIELGSSRERRHGLGCRLGGCGGFE